MEDSQIIEAACIFKKESVRPLSEYQKRINEEAGILALQNPSLLTTRGVLLEQARERVVEAGYEFKKGKSRSKKYKDVNETPTRKYTSKVIRERRLEEINEEISQLDKQISFKQKRVEQAELAKNYKICDEVTEEIGTIKSDRRVLANEKKSIMKKVQQAKWYSSRKKRMSASSCTSTGNESDSTDIMSPPSSKVPCAENYVVSPPPPRPATPTASYSIDLTQESPLSSKETRRVSLSGPSSPSVSSVSSPVEQSPFSPPQLDTSPLSRCKSTPPGGAQQSYLSSPRSTTLALSRSISTPPGFPNSIDLTQQSQPGGYSLSHLNATSRDVDATQQPPSLSRMPGATSQDFHLGLPVNL